MMKRTAAYLDDIWYYYQLNFYGIIVGWPGIVQERIGPECLQTRLDLEWIGYRNYTNL
jgi:hypothetical protein